MHGVLARLEPQHDVARAVSGGLDYNAILACASASLICLPCHPATLLPQELGEAVAANWSALQASSGSLLPKQQQQRLHTLLGAERQRRQWQHGLDPAALQAADSMSGGALNAPRSVLDSLHRAGKSGADLDALDGLTQAAAGSRAMPAADERPAPASGAWAAGPPPSLVPMPGASADGPSPARGPAAAPERSSGAGSGPGGAAAGGSSALEQKQRRLELLKQQLVLKRAAAAQAAGAGCTEPGSSPAGSPAGTAAPALETATQAAVPVAALASPADIAMACEAEPAVVGSAATPAVQHGGSAASAQLEALEQRSLAQLQGGRQSGAQHMEAFEPEQPAAAAAAPACCPASPPPMKRQRGSVAFTPSPILSSASATCPAPHLNLPAAPFGGASRSPVAFALPDPPAPGAAGALSCPVELLAGSGHSSGINDGASVLSKHKGGGHSSPDLSTSQLECIGQGSGCSADAHEPIASAAAMEVDGRPASMDF